MKSSDDTDCFVEDYGYTMIEEFLQILGGKWKIQIIYHLSKNPCLRYGKLKRQIPDISHKVLSSQLKELERHHLISRVEYDEKISKVAYSLTKIGQSLFFYLQINWKLVY